MSVDFQHTAVRGRAWYKTQRFADVPGTHSTNSGRDLVGRDDAVGGAVHDERGALHARDHLLGREHVGQLGRQPRRQHPRVFAHLPI